MSRVAYLCGSPRISTRFQAEEHGPACHVQGAIGGFRSAGWDVSPYIVGDRVPPRWLAGKGLHSSAGGLKRMAADVFRMASNFHHGRKAFREMSGNADWAYERFGVFQSMGAVFQRAGIPWILETNTPFALENSWEPARKSVCFSRAAREHERRAYQCCDALVVQTLALKDIVIRFAGIGAEKIVVVPNAVGLQRFDAPPPIRKFSGPTIGFVGALRRWQALENPIRAIRDLADEGMPYNLVIVGAGEKQQEWRGLVQALGLEERVVFAGSIPMEQIPAWIAGFDIGFCGPLGSVAGQPMYFSPLKLYEYMAAAKPVLASSHDDARRLIVPGETGYLFETDSLPDLERVLRQAWTERDSWSAMGVRARNMIAAGHTWDIRIKDMIAQLHEFLPARSLRAVG